MFDIYIKVEEGVRYHPTGGGKAAPPKGRSTAPPKGGGRKKQHHQKTTQGETSLFQTKIELNFKTTDIYTFSETKERTLRDSPRF